MAVHISCPQCNQNFSFSEAFPGSKVNCPKCQAILILALESAADLGGFVVKPGPKVVPLEDASTVRQMALKHLEQWLDVDVLQLKNVLEWIDTDKAYTFWKIPKGNGGTFREITAPCEALKNVQRRILDRLLYRVPVSNASHGFIPGRSIVTNANLHLKTAGAIFNLDLKDAFPSVTSTRVKHLYVRYLKISLKHLGENVPHEILDEAIELLLKLTTYKNALPQGGPCSGYLLNMACITLDKNLYRLLSKHGASYTYTRYADDITVSSPTSVPDNLQQEIQKVIHDCGFQINPRKCGYSVRAQGQRLEVTGLILEKNKVRIPTDKMEIFRATLHNAGNIPTEQLTQEKRLEIQSIIAFIKMVYNQIPYRIWVPYKAYLEKHGILYSKKVSKTYLDLYPH